jgi:hypothetical protein
MAESYIHKKTAEFVDVVRSQGSSTGFTGFDHLVLYEVLLRGSRGSFTRFAEFGGELVIRAAMSTPNENS